LYPCHALDALEIAAFGVAGGFVFVAVGVPDGFVLVAFVAVGVPDGFVLVARSQVALQQLT
jgi:hypothetical protein